MENINASENLVNSPTMGPFEDTQCPLPNSKYFSWMRSLSPSTFLRNHSPKLTSSSILSSSAVTASREFDPRPMLSSSRCHRRAVRRSTLARQLDRVWESWVCRESMRTPTPDVPLALMGVGVLVEGPAGSEGWRCLSLATVGCGCGCDATATEVRTGAGAAKAWAGLPAMKSLAIGLKTCACGPARGVAGVLRGSALALEDLTCFVEWVVDLRLC